MWFFFKQQRKLVVLFYRFDDALAVCDAHDQSEEKNSKKGQERQKQVVTALLALQFLRVATACTVTLCLIHGSYTLVHSTGNDSGALFIAQHEDLVEVFLRACDAAWVLALYNIFDATWQHDVLFLHKLTVFNGCIR